MSEKTKINCTSATLEQMRCSSCMGYLSSSPVRVLPDGSCICGLCFPTNLDAPVYRVVPFEIILRQMSFPCQFKEHGCTETVLFDRAADHQSKCTYRSFACPSTSCAWEGSLTKMRSHFSEQHLELIQEKAEFKFKLDQNTQKVFMVVKEDVAFVVKYCYNVNENCLKYDVRYCINLPGFDAKCKILLISGTDSDCSLNLKATMCLPYSNRFNDMQNAVHLNLSNYLECLGNPVSIVAAMNLNITKPRYYVVHKTNVVNYELLESVRCKICKNYLIPPIFEDGDVTMCCYCAKSHNYYSELPLSKNKELVKLVTEMNFPCKWRDCSFVGKGNAIQGHNLSCEFRQYRCFIPDCSTFMLLSSVARHFRNHEDGQYLPHGIYKTSFLEHCVKFVCTIINDILITMKYCIELRDRYNRGPKHAVYLLSDLDKLEVTLQFEHRHCNLKSQLFTIDNNKSRYVITLKELPSCFKDSDELSVVIGNPVRI